MPSAGCIQYVKWVGIVWQGTCELVAVPVLSAGCILCARCVLGGPALAQKACPGPTTGHDPLATPATAPSSSVHTEVSLHCCIHTGNLHKGILNWTRFVALSGKIPPVVSRSEISTLTVTLTMKTAIKNCHKTPQPSRMHHYTMKLSEHKKEDHLWVPGGSCLQ